MKRLYIIAGCNGAGKTTASYTILPEMLNCHEFVNADEIAKGLSPFNPYKAAIHAGKIMANRIHALMDAGVDFAFETTLAPKTNRQLVEKAKASGYKVVLIFFWLSSPDLAVKRVETRVKEGGHGIPEKVIRRRYENGLSNFFNIFKPIVDEWMFIDNSEVPYKIIGDGNIGTSNIFSNIAWSNLRDRYKK